MKQLLIIPLVLTGCMSSIPTIDELIDPDQTIHIPSNVAELAPVPSPQDGKKGPFPPGRIINYKGHGLGYDSHITHHRHHNHYE